jgi:two-component system chemotaxis sensor kinase CheA
VPYRDRDVPIVRLSDLLGFENHRPLNDSEIVIATGLEGAVGLVVDRALAEQTVLVKQLGKILKRVPHVSGATILSSGRVAVILDMHTLAIAALRHGGQWVEIQATAAPIARKTLLVVDDSLTTRELIRGLLEAAGYDVVTARHGREAWDLLQSSLHPDLVVSDVSMPEMDGYQLTSKIKSDDRLSRLPVVLVTSLSKPEEEARGIAAGADAYIVKGAFNQSGLLARVEALVAHD